MNDPIFALQAGLTARERQQLEAQLYRLLAQQVRAYTGGDSSSVPVEIAEALLQSALYCMGVRAGGDPAQGRRLLERGVDNAYTAGVQRLELKLAFGRALWQRACDRLPPVENQSMLDTLASIGTFWKKYDCRYFAHEIPCDIDYQLALPVPEELCGVDYVNHYLDQLLAENDFLRHFSADALIPVLNRHSPDYRGLLISLFEPVATNALGRTLLHLDPLPLYIDPADCGRLRALLDPLPLPELRRCLRDAALALTERLSIHRERTAAALRDFAPLLAPRIASARDTGGTNGIFLEPLYRSGDAAHPAPTDGRPNA